ncbi:glutamyl-tRNA reductase [Aeromicrobium wangtongii]|uniref:Glutamyl-tRNA reductase n=1 Tax=Aeromicrobium wangtongii TaxID=2969247 RepID=A0ABY5M579_9ACTN|nr:glutamyl-tRNA reductase [Aeromicrobium wangtongii]MCD9200063.1 glutamyl-tRNA reductase [Aeromicrobium wangtongii]UUP13320.1 glutamyl-tRNA reductase [Aeromicrobium wangtongii]
MSVLVVGMSHKSAPIDVLEHASLDSEAAVKLSHLVLDAPYVSESVVISTCNRVEIYVEAERFHGAVEEVSRLLAELSGLDRDEFVRHVYVHFDEAAVAHLFGVAAGMDSMILGESQILGQVRDALHSAQAESTVGSALNALFQQALRIGKRGHAETGIDRLAPSIVTAGLDAAGAAVDAADTRFLVAGAGTMASLAVRTLIDRGVEPHRIMVANRTYERAHNLVATFGVSAVRWQAMDVELAAADVLISCTGASGVVFDRDRIVTARGGRPTSLIDLALPRDIDPAVSELDNVDLVDLMVLSQLAANAELADDVAQVRTIVESEVRTFLAAKAASHITPTVVALRTMATEIVASEQARIESRLPNLTDAERADVRKALHRVAEKLIHAPTVRVQQLIDGPEDLTYADALADLFALDQSRVDAVTRSGETS